MIYFITGGQRSGKSRYAQDLALSLSENPVYIATARVWDKEFKERIDRHKSDRSGAWTNIEEEKYISRLDIKGKICVIDCVTLWITNFFTDSKYDLEQSLKIAKDEIDKLCEIECTLIIISNEIGMGIHAESEIGRKFTDLQGWINQYIAEKADEVILMVSGISVKIKSKYI
jgi:adenosylcobinamide kinase/adenosylcobinamide-phosphate guanylyltransferase